MSSLLLSTVALISSAYAESYCRWIVPDNRGGELILDLTPLAGAEMGTLGDNDYYSYHYSVCSDYESCFGSGFNTMAIQYNRNNENECYVLSEWYQDSQPTFSYYDGQPAFTFNYIGNDKTNCSHARVWQPKFICDPDRDYYIDYVVESEPCVYSVNIYTQYACVEVTTWSPFSSTVEPYTSSWESTLPTFGGCEWQTNDGKHVLNMEGVAGESLSVIDKQRNDLYYVYTPCTNTFRCNGDVFSMAYLFNVTSFECSKYLAIWEDGGVFPTYSPSKKIWEFVYTNGQKCGGLENVFIVDWICDPYAKSPKIVQAQQTGTCLYQLFINSTVACH